ncbi:hypothetical protein Gotur_020907, partial [Gossypium turneri]
MSELLRVYFTLEKVELVVNNDALCFCQELYSNNISGIIPEDLGNLTNLVSLDLYLNTLTGHIPSTLGKLQKLRFLRLNNNTLAGQIPMPLTTIMSLQVLDLSNNKLEGDIPVNGSFSLFTPISFANNRLNNPPPAPPPPITPTAPIPSGNSATGAIAGGVAAGAALLFAAPAIVLVWWRKKKPQDHFFDVPAEEDPEVHLGQLKRFSLRELQVATDNFSNKNILGRGGFGKVYKGRLADGSLVAVKRLKEERTQGGELQFQTEVEMISMAVHRNLLRLRGFCMTPTERLLVYPFMVNGSVASCLRGNSATGAIAGGVAAGIALLFAAPAIVLAWWLKRKPQDLFFDVPAEEDPEVHLGQLKRFSLRELQVATNNFSNKNILGRGGFGKVYKGRLADDSPVAVKRLEERTQRVKLQFQTEVEIISMAVHRNLLRLRGFCKTPTELLLVYPFMVNGSVASCLRGTGCCLLVYFFSLMFHICAVLSVLERPESQAPLDLAMRKRIAVGAARGLAYLHDHCDPKIIHRDVKAANILLDEEFEAVVGDFGLA